MTKVEIMANKGEALGLADSKDVEVTVLVMKKKEGHGAEKNCVNRCNTHVTRTSGRD